MTTRAVFTKIAQLFQQIWQCKYQISNFGAIARGASLAKEKKLNARLSFYAQKCIFICIKQTSLPFLISH